MTAGGPGAAEALTDPAPLLRALLRRPSVTPADAGAQDVLARALEALGFQVHRLRFGAVENLFARRGAGRPHFCFAGHTDVVPPGDGWTADPFGAEERDGAILGRGACDMKGAVAAFVAAAARRLRDGEPAGSVSLLITGDEEGEAADGTVRVLEWMEANGHVPDFCLVGEPTNPERLGDAIKIGRRGSLRARIAVHGVQGHSAYPQRADNPVHRLVAILAELTSMTLDEGTAWFEPSRLQVTSVDVGNAAENVIPASARARLNVRFNDLHSGASLTAMLRGVCARHAERFELEAPPASEPFLTRPGADVERLRAAVAAATGRSPRLDTGGGTSDARFIARVCPVAEFGLVGATMHQADERVDAADLRALAEVYRGVIVAFAG